tara:strand:+ start:69 stop:299 length:231 start_codon:yes stop_codon:yes gene_type:complete
MKKHIISFSVLLFVAIYLILNNVKPSFLYTNEGTLRPFGLGYKNKTVIPLWLIAIISAILSYTMVLYWLTLPRLQF